MLKETRRQGVQGVQDNSLLAPNYLEQMSKSRELSNVLNSLNSLNSVNSKEQVSLRKLNNHKVQSLKFKV